MRLMDSIPLVVLTGQVATHLIGTDAFQECDTVGITRPCTKHNWLVKDVNDLSRVLHEAFQIATTGRPGPVVVDIPKDVQFKNGAYVTPAASASSHLPAQDRSGPGRDRQGGRDDGGGQAARSSIPAAASSIPARKPARLLRELVDADRLSHHLDPDGAGRVSRLARRNGWACWACTAPRKPIIAMHDCDLMICLGARFDDRVTGRIDAFSPGSKKIHLDIDASQINKIVRVDLPHRRRCRPRRCARWSHFWKTQKRKVRGRRR